MDREELRSIQGPIKDRYRANPESALVTLRAQSRMGEGVTCKIETGRALVEAGLHPATGGDGMSACSGDMLLEALAACAGVTLAAVSTSLGIDIQQATIHVEGDLDFRGTLGVSKDVPVGFQKIRLRFELHSGASADDLETLIRLTERYCVVFQTLRTPPELSITKEVTRTQRS